MAKDGALQDSSNLNLLASDEPLPFRVLNATCTAPMLLVCDHASRRFPKALGGMGLDPFARRCHLAWDIGAGPLTECLAASLGVTAVLAQYSRLVVDCNRDLFDPGAFLEFGDGVVIPGNRHLNQAQKDQRASELYWPYHDAIDVELKRLAAYDCPTGFFAIHSFTPVMNGISRDVEIGILWDADRSTAEILIEGFRKAGFKVGDNEPYSGKAPQDFTIDHHAEDADLPHVGIEIRQDLIDGDTGVQAIASVLHAIIKPIVDRSHDSSLLVSPAGA
ncbi:MAG: N-formylglutamate amidohydrolase [Proteobacteria bacterium]|nr:N-formylglutamate amidohydrolase [Pseudomonadota bacterium]